MTEQSKHSVLYWKASVYHATQTEDEF